MKIASYLALIGAIILLSLGVFVFEKHEPIICKNSLNASPLKCEALKTQVVHKVEQNPLQKIESSFKICNLTSKNQECTQENLKAWDKLLNKEYSILMKDEYLSDEFKKNLKATQIAWIKYKDNSIKAINSYYNTLQGSIFSNKLGGLNNIEIVNITKSRALELCKLRLSVFMANTDDFECGVE